MSRAHDIVIERLMSGIFGEDAGTGKDTAAKSGTFAGKGKTEITDAEMAGSGIAPPPQAQNMSLKFLGGLGGEIPFPGFSKSEVEWDSGSNFLDPLTEGPKSPPAGGVIEDTSGGPESEFANPGSHGGGGRFARLKGKLAKKKGVKNPAALAAKLEREKGWM